MGGKYRRERFFTVLEAAFSTRLMGRRPPRPQMVHLEGGSHDGRHVQIFTTDRTIKLGDRTGPSYWRTRRVAEDHGCGLTVFVPAPLRPGEMPPDPSLLGVLKRMYTPHEPLD